MSNVPAKNKNNGKRSKVNIVQRTTSETLRLTDSGRTPTMSNQPPKKKPTSSFQVTGVSVISGDTGDDSNDDLDESRTDETSVSDDTFSKDTDEAHLSQNVSTIPSSLSSVPSAVISSIRSSDTSMETASSSTEVNVPTGSTKNFSDRFKVVKVESTVPFSRGRWTCMDYLDHSIHTPKDAYIYSQQLQQYVKSSVEMCDQYIQTVQTTSVPITNQGQSPTTISQSIPSQTLLKDGNNQQVHQTVQINNNGDCVQKTPVQTSVQKEKTRQPIEAVMMDEEQLLPDGNLMQLPYNFIAQNVYQQFNPGDLYSPSNYTPYQSVPTLYNQRCPGLVPQMEFYPTSFRYDLPWLIYTGINAPISVRYLPPQSQQIPQSVSFSPNLPNEAMYAQQNYVPSLGNDQPVQKNQPPKGERRPETTTAAFTTKESFTNVTATSPACAQSMCQIAEPPEKNEMIDNKNLKRPPSTTDRISNTQPVSIEPQVTEVPIPCTVSSVITAPSTSNNNDISVSSVQTNSNCVAIIKVDNETAVASNQITKSMSSEDTESVSGGSTVAIDNKIAQAMDLVKSHLMYAVREEVEVLKERISELLDRINQLEVENSFLRANVPAEVLSALNDNTVESQQKKGPNDCNTRRGLN